MILIENFSQVIAQIESERGIEKGIILDAIEKALISAAKKKFSPDLNVKAVINSDSGETRLWMEKTVVDESDDENELSLKEAKELNSDSEIGDILEIDLEVEEFGRIAAQTAKQVILQCIREAEKDLILEEFADKVGQIVSGTVQNIEGNTYLINLGKVEAFLPPREQVPGEKFNVKDRIRVYIIDIQKSNRGPMIKISRSHTGLVRELFKLEVPEIQDNIIEIKGISRDPGRRTKIAVKSNNPSVGAVGTCVGHMGNRIQTILRELNNEKIDILEWNEDPATFISNSLKPATISNVIINDAELREATVVVPDDQLSLAIGKAGQNVRLAVKLTNWKLDISNESDQNKSASPKPSSSLAEKIQAASRNESNDKALETDAEVEETVAEAEEATTDSSKEVSNETVSETEEATTDSSEEVSDETIAEAEEATTDSSEEVSDEIVAEVEKS